MKSLPEKFEDFLDRINDDDYSAYLDNYDSKFETEMEDLYDTLQSFDMDDHEDIVKEIVTNSVDIHYTDLDKWVAACDCVDCLEEELKLMVGADHFASTTYYQRLQALQETDRMQNYGYPLINLIDAWIGIVNNEEDNPEEEEQ